jgi:YfiH family protein
MTSPCIPIHKPVELRLSNGDSYLFHCYQWKSIRFGWFDCYSKQGKPLDFSQKEPYYPLLEKFQLKMVSLEQIHGSIIHEPDFNTNEPIISACGQGDGFFTGSKSLALSIRTADCVPVFLFNDERICVLHCGYKSILSGILNNALSLFEKDSHTNIKMAIGPHIGYCCFEVKKDVLSLFAKFQLFNRGDIINVGEAAHVNLSGLIRDWFLLHGGRADYFFNFSQCTVCNQSYHSHRRNGTTDRMGHLIWMEA